MADWIFFVDRQLLADAESSNNIRNLNRYDMNYILPVWPKPPLPRSVAEIFFTVFHLTFST